MTTCTRCGMHLKEPGERCPLCGRRMDLDPNVLVQEIQASFSPRAHWEVPEALARPSPKPVYSRLHAGPLTFGLLGRIGWTFLVVFSLLVALLQAGINPFGFVTTGLLSIGAGYVLRQIWGKYRIR